MPVEKKRRGSELETDVECQGKLVSTLQKENTTLEEKVKEMEAKMKAMGEEIAGLKAKLAEYEEEEDDDDEEDEESVCDGSPWSQKYHLLKQYKQRHGSCKVPKKDKDLGSWVDNTRTAFRQKKKSLTQERIDKLNKIGFYWGKGNPEPRTWDDNFRDLKEFYDTFGHSNVHIDPNPALQNDLAKWVKEQRKQGKRLEKAKPSDMTMEQYNRLKDLDFKWRVPKPRQRS